MHIVTQLSGRVTALYSQALAWLKAQLWRLANNLRASITQVFQSVRGLQLLSLLAPIVSNTKAWLVNLTIQGQLIKAALINVQAKLILLGSQLLTIVLQTSQLVLTVLLQSKDKLVASIKLAQSHLKTSKIVLTPMVLLFRQGGLKLQEIVSQLQQRVTQVFKKDK